MIAIAIALFAAMGADQPAADATPETPAAAAAPATTAERARADPDRLVCRREAKANSRFTTKVCKTVAEWEQRAETARQAFGEVQDRPVVDVSRGN